MEVPIWIDPEPREGDCSERLPTSDDRNADAPPVARVVACYHCSTAFHWPGLESEQTTCPHCTAQIVVLLERDGTCEVRPTTRDSIDEMICDWIEDRSGEEDEFEDDDYDEDEFGGSDSSVQIDAA